MWKIKIWMVKTKTNLNRIFTDWLNFKLSTQYGENWENGAANTESGTGPWFQKNGSSCDSCFGSGRRNILMYVQRRARPKRLNNVASGLANDDPRSEWTINA